MGNTAAKPTSPPASPTPVADQTVINAHSKLKPMRERLRYGVCSVKIAPIANGQRRPSDRMTSYFVTPRGSLIHGTQCNPQLIQRGMHTFIT